MSTRHPSSHALRLARALLLALGMALGAVAAGADGFAAVLNASAGPNVPLATMPEITRVIVHKGARRLELLSGTQVVRSYPVSLGLQPQGHKQRAGDFRTPEGRYHLVGRNPRSDFFLSIQVSYPNERDVKNAAANGWEPGGSIMIHGLPNRLKHDPDYYTRDWTDGCIAVSNSAMVEIWLFTDQNTPIDILP